MLEVHESESSHSKERAQKTDKEYYRLSHIKQANFQTNLKSIITRNITNLNSFQGVGPACENYLHAVIVTES